MGSSFSGLGIGLSFVFGCILMGLIAELYYLLWWKKRIANSTSETPQEEQDLEMSKSAAKDDFSEEGIEQELMRIHNLNGPPRFLFTINEESREDLESESRTRSLSDVVFASPSDILEMKMNPLFETVTEAELDRFRSSPPPKFKFLKDAEDKMLMKMIKDGRIG